MHYWQPRVTNYSRVISFPQALILWTWEEGEWGNSLPLFWESVHMFVELFCPGWEPWEPLRKSSTDGARITSQTSAPSCFVTNSQNIFVTDTWDTHLVSTQGPYKNTGVSKSFTQTPFIYPRMFYRQNAYCTLCLHINHERLNIIETNHL